MATAKKTPKAEPAPGLRIQQLNITNVKRIVAVEVKPDGKGGLVIIGGDNGAGKSSTLDAIIYGLGGKKAVPKNSKPLREGADEGQVRIDLAQLVITRTWRANGVDQLVLTTADGHKIADTAAVLDSLTSDLSFDPLAFISTKPVDRRSELLDIIQLPFNLAEKNHERDTVFNDRTDINRQLKSARAVVENAQSEIGGISMDGPTLEEALQQLHTANDWFFRADALDDAVGRAETAHAEGVQRITELEAQLDMARLAMGPLDDALEQAAAERGDHGYEEPSTDAMEAQVAEARQRHSQSAAIAEHDRMSEQAENLAAESKVLTERIESIDKELADALRNAKMPVDGLGFDDHDVTYNGLPFAQASSAEQLRVSCAIAMARKPTARIMLSRDGSLLDQKNLAVLGEMCEGEGWQLWLERVGDGDEGAVIIEDGRRRGA